MPRTALGIFLRHLHHPSREHGTTNRQLLRHYTLATLAQGILHTRAATELKAIVALVAALCVFAAGAGWPALHHRPGHDGNVASIAVSPDGKRLASIDWNRSLRLWDAATGKPLDWRPTRRFRGVSSTFSPDGKWFIGAGDGAVQFWDVATGKEGRHFDIEDLRGAKGKHEVWELVLSSDGRRLTALTLGGKGLQLNIWDIRTGQSIARRPYRRRTQPHSSVLTPDDARVIVPNSEGTRPGMLSDGTLTLEDTATGQLLLTIPRKLGSPLTFSPDGKLLAAGIHRSLGMERGYQVKSVSVTETATGEEVLLRDLSPSPFSVEPASDSAC